MLVSPQVNSAKGRNDEQRKGIELRCPRCLASIGILEDADETPFDCHACWLRLGRERGIWRALLPAREAVYARFMQDYESIRAAEGRGNANADYYLALPYRDLSGLHSSQWDMRARTFAYIERKIVPRVTASTQQKLRILDLGAGNGWMSHRLARKGHMPVAVDLLTNDRDGLGAARHYTQRLHCLFPRFQAELDNLPFGDNQFDLVVFNSSFHYSEDYEKTLAEAIRCTRDRGTVVIADTPWYSDEGSGLQMVEERRRLFIKRYGFPSDALKSLEFLTDQRLEGLEKRFNIQFDRHAPNYGIRWRMRPWMARLRRSRKPSRFRIYTAGIVK